jgi:uncharacterized membrane protein
VSRKSRKLATLQRKMAALERRGMDGDGRRATDLAGGAVMVTHQQIQSFHQGPFPAPDTLAQYAQIRPDMLDRVMGLTERQAAHRQELEREIVRHDAKGTARSTYCALAVAIAGLGVTGYLGHLHLEIAAAIVGSMDLVGLVGVFIYGKKKKDGASAGSPSPGTPQLPGSR